MSSKILSRFFLFLISALLINITLAQNNSISGTWSGSVTLNNGNQLPFIAVLEQNGNVVTGILQGIGGAPDVTIMDGRIENDIRSFFRCQLIQGRMSGLTILVRMWVITSTSPSFVLALPALTRCSIR